MTKILTEYSMGIQTNNLAPGETNDGWMEKLIETENQIIDTAVMNAAFQFVDVDTTSPYNHNSPLEPQLNRKERRAQQALLRKQK